MKIKNKDLVKKYYSVKILVIQYKLINETQKVLSLKKLKFKKLEKSLTKEHRI